MSVAQTIQNCANTLEANTRLGRKIDLPLTVDFGMYSRKCPVKRLPSPGV